MNASALVEVAHLLGLGDYHVGGRPLVDDPDALPGALAREIARRIESFGRQSPPAPPSGLFEVRAAAPPTAENRRLQRPGHEGESHDA